MNDNEATIVKLPARRIPWNKGKLIGAKPPLRPSHVWSIRTKLQIDYSNPIYIDAALRQLRKEGFDVRDEDVARLSPLGHEHINMLGRYAFSLPARIARGELRPLRNPAMASEDA